MANKDPELNRQYMRAYMLARYNRRVQEAKMRLGGVCVRCGIADGLEFDHIERQLKSFTLTKFLAGCSKAKFESEIVKCQLLCVECHKEKTRADMGWIKEHIVTLKCAFCDQPVERSSRTIPARQTDFYCNRSCMASHFGRGRPKNKGY